MEPPTPIAEVRSELANLPDEEVHKRYKEFADQNAYTLLYSKYYRRVLSRVHSAWSNHASVINSAQDVAHDALMACLERSPFEGDGDRLFRKTLFSIVKNKCCDIQRRFKQEPMRDAPEGEDQSLPQEVFYDVSAERRRIDRDFEDRELLHLLDECKAILTPRAREVYRMRIVDEMTFEDIGAALGGISHQAAQKIFKRLENALKRCLHAKGVLKLESD